MHTVKTVSFSEKEVEIREKEVRSKKRTVDAYDMEDPFYQEDEAINAFECSYKNFFCLSGENHVERKREESEEKDDRMKKEKRETTRERYLQEKQEMLEEYASNPKEALSVFIKRLVTLEILTAQELRKDVLLEKVEKANPSVNKEEASTWIDEYISRDGLEALQKEIEDRSRNMLSELKGSIDEKIDENIRMNQEDGNVHPKQIKFDEEFLNRLKNYTDTEYLLFYIRLFLGGRKRILEHKVKKNIIKELKEIFPVEYRSNSLGKKIASYIVKKRKSEQNKESLSEENPDSNSNTEEDTQLTPPDTDRKETHSGQTENRESVPSEIAEDIIEEQASQGESNRIDTLDRDSSSESMHIPDISDNTYNSLETEKKTLSDKNSPPVKDTTGTSRKRRKQEIDTLSTLYTLSPSQTTPNKEEKDALKIIDPKAIMPKPLDSFVELKKAVPEKKKTKQEVARAEHTVKTKGPDKTDKYKKSKHPPNEKDTHTKERGLSEEYFSSEETEQSSNSYYETISI